jgi:hypothetical protein
MEEEQSGEGKLSAPEWHTHEVLGIWDTAKPAVSQTQCLVAQVNDSITQL